MGFMKRHQLISILIACAASVSVTAINAVTAHSAPEKNVSARETSAETYPKIVDGEVSPDAKIVLNAAKIAFKSNRATVAAAAKPVTEVDRNLVIFPVGDEEISCLPAYVTRTDRIGDAKIMCIQKIPYKGTRMAVREKYFNWQGDMFAAVITNSTESADEIFKKLDKCSFNSEEKNIFKPIFVETWQRPWIFRNPKDEKFIAVDTQHPGGFLEDWDVYVANPDASRKLICKIRFRPPGENVMLLMPKGPIREIAQLLDNIVGQPRKNEGTLHSTDRVRIEAKRTWANVLFRPWARSSNEKPSKVAVDKHLKRWSKGAPAYRAQYAKLQALYPKAQAALAQYYEDRFKKPRAECVKMATAQLELAYRSNFQL